MDPINYVAQMNDPTSSVMAGYNSALDAQAARQNMEVQKSQLGIQQDANARANEMQPYQIEGAQLGMDAQRQGMAAQAQQMQIQQEQSTRRQAFQSDMAALAQLGADATVQDFARVQAQYPELGQNIMQTFSAMDEPRQRNTASIIAQGAFALKNGNTDQAISLLTQYAEAADLSGDAAGAASARAILEVAKVNPDAALSSAGIALYSISPELAGKVFDLGGGDATVSRSEMVGPTVSVQTMNDGSTRVVDTTTNQVLTGEAARQAIEAGRAGVVSDQRQINAAREGGKLEERITLGGEAAAAEEAGTLSARAEGIGAVNEQAALGTARGTVRGEEEASVREMERNMPGLRTVVDQLYDLSNDATYTGAGRLRDQARRQLGLNPSEGAVAAAEYLAVVDNQVLPLLRQTFGAAFTAKEGETLRATLGNPNASPVEKHAVLRAFISQKERDLAAAQSSVGQTAPAAPAAPTAQPSFLQYGGGN